MVYAHRFELAPSQHYMAMFGYSFPGSFGACCLSSACLSTACSMGQDHSAAPYLVQPHLPVTCDSVAPAVTGRRESLGRVPAHTSQEQMGTFRHLYPILLMQLQGCMMQSLWLLWAQHGPATRSTTSLSTWPTTKDLAESGFGRAVRSVYDQQPVKPSNVSAALSLIMLARLGAALGAARAAAPFPPPSARREGGTRLRKLPPSLPSSLPCL